MATVALLTPIKDKHLKKFLTMSIDMYAQSMVDSGEYPNRTVPDSLSRNEVNGYFPNGKLRANEHIFSIVNHKKEVIGTTWVTLIPEATRLRAFLVWIDIQPAHRRKGHAQEAMDAIEKFLRERSVHSLTLVVFAHNQQARQLYQKLGYSVSRPKRYGSAVAPSRYEMRKFL